jgi:hypothetical protein
VDEASPPPTLSRQPDRPARALHDERGSAC